jgi:hypothetical protein
MVIDGDRRERRRGLQRAPPAVSARVQCGSGSTPADRRPTLRTRPAVRPHAIRMQRADASGFRPIATQRNRVGRAAVLHQLGHSPPPIESSSTLITASLSGRARRHVDSLGTGQQAQPGAGRTAPLLQSTFQEQALALAGEGGDHALLGAHFSRRRAYRQRARRDRRCGCRIPDSVGALCHRDHFADRAHHLGTSHAGALSPVRVWTGARARVLPAAGARRSSTDRRKVSLTEVKTTIRRWFRFRAGNNETERRRIRKSNDGD